jgi:hypothetical protein
MANKMKNSPVFALTLVAFSPLFGSYLRFDRNDQKLLWYDEIFTALWYSGHDLQLFPQLANLHLPMGQSLDEKVKILYITNDDLPVIPTRYSNVFILAPSEKSETGSNQARDRRWMRYYREASSTEWLLSRRLR